MGHSGADLGAMASIADNKVTIGNGFIVRDIEIITFVRVSDSALNMGHLSLSCVPRFLCAETLMVQVLQKKHHCLDCRLILLSTIVL